MDAFTDETVRVIVFMKSAQVGATEILNNMLGYVVHLAPGPTLVLQPTLEMARAWSKERLAPMLRDTPALRGRITDPRAKDSDNTILEKGFSGGHLAIAGANSPPSLASRPRRYLFGDEIDKYPASAGASGDPLALGRKRLQAFSNSKEYYASTPLKRRESRIEALFESSDQCHYHVPCPECGFFQRLVWGQLRWLRALEDGTRVPAAEETYRGKGQHLPDTAVYVCEGCGAEIPDHSKGRMLALGEWRASAEGAAGVRGFHINELYSPFSTWPEMVAAWVEAKRLPETLRAFINEALGETWEEPGEVFDPADLKARRERYECPVEVLVVTAGVDVQDDRLEVERVGWGMHYESWGLEWRQFLGDPTMPDVWRELDEWLRTPTVRDDGRTLQISAACVDSGHHTDEVYRFTKGKWARRVFAVKGLGGAGIGAPIVGRVSRNNKRRAPFFPVNVDQCKDRLFAWLSLDEPGPGFVHLPMRYDEEFCYQLTAEKRVERVLNGQRVRAYRQIRTRNEALDLRNYAMAALEILNPRWDRLAQRLHDTPPPSEPPPPAVTGPRAARRQPPAPRPRGGWTSNW